MLLASGHGLKTTLAGSFSNSETRAHMTVIRTQGFINFEDFLHANGSPLSPYELYCRVLVCLSVNNNDDAIPLSACATLMRYVTALWNNSLRKWVRTSSCGTPIRDVEWRPELRQNTSFLATNNKMLNKFAATLEPPRKPHNLIKINHRPLVLCWKREQAMMRNLAPSRRDLLRRLTRNALPLGIKRIHWDTETQIRCMLCDANAVETARHLFWECPYARDTWGGLVDAWRNHNNAAVGWKEVLTGYEVRVNYTCNKVVENLWTIVRACIIRTIWFERNRRYFYADLQIRSAAYRHNQGKDDIKVHVESWFRRAKESEKEYLTNAVTYLTSKTEIYEMINITSNTPYEAM